MASPLPLHSSSLSCQYAQIEISQVISSVLGEGEGGATEGDLLSNGLRSSGVAVPQLRQRYGLNELQVEQPESLLAKLKEQFENPLILLLFGSALVSLFLGQYDDAFSIALAISIVVTVAFIQEYRSEQSLHALNKLVPHYCHVLRDGKNSTMLASELVPGDVVKFKTGDRVPADVRLFQSVDLQVDESSLTGETEPVKKNSSTVLISKAKSTINNDSIRPLPLHELPLAERCNICFMGTLVRHGSGTAIVIATGSNTEIGLIFSMMKEVEQKKTPLQEKMNLLGKQLSMASFVVIGFIVLVGIIQQRNWLEMLTIGVSLAVAAIPEGLPIVVTVTLALGVLRMANRQAIVKKLPTVEGLGCVNVLCADKTGTLTLNKMQVCKLMTCSNNRIYNDSDLLQTPGSPSALDFDSPDIKMLLRIGNLCNNAHTAANDKESLDERQSIGQSTEIALLEFCRKAGLADSRECYRRVSEIPFSSERKYMAVQCCHDQDPVNDCRYYVKGSLEALLSVCKRIYISEVESRLLDASAIESIREHEDRIASSDGGLRCLYFAVGSSLDSMSLVGLIAMSDPPRAGIDEVISKLIAGGVRVAMITGDGEKTAIAIAKRLGICEIDDSPHSSVVSISAAEDGSDSLLLNDNSVPSDHNVDGTSYPPSTPYSSRPSSFSALRTTILSGSELDSLSEQQFQALVKQVTVFYRTTPKHKMSIIRALQAGGDVVAMTGDGVNDAPALKLADIGISMGKAGTDVSKEASDMILVNDDFATILYAIEEGKSIYYNIQNFLRFQLSTSISALSLIAFSTLIGFPNPLNAMQILWINILCDGPVAQSLGVEEVDPEVRKKLPRSKDDHIISGAFIQRTLLNSFVMVTGIMIVYAIEAKDGEERRVTTMTFTAFVLFDIFNALSCRSASRSIFSLGFFSNRMFNIATGFCLAAQLLVIYTPFLQSIFQTEAASLSDLAFLVALASCVFWVDETRKLAASLNLQPFTHRRRSPRTLLAQGLAFFRSTKH